MGCLEDLEKERARLNTPQMEDAFVVVNRRNAMRRQKDMAVEIACLAEGIKEVHQWMMKKDITGTEYELHIWKSMEHIQETVNKLMQPGAYLQRNMAFFQQQDLLNMFNKLEKSC